MGEKLQSRVIFLREKENWIRKEEGGRRKDHFPFVPEKAKGHFFFFPVHLS